MGCGVIGLRLRQAAMELFISLAVCSCLASDSWCARSHSRSENGARSECDACQGRRCGGRDIDRVVRDSLVVVVVWFHEPQD